MISFLPKFFLDTSNKLYREIFAIFLGALATISLSPFYATFILVVVFPLLHDLIISSETKKDSFFIGFWFGFSFFVTGLYWIIFSLGLDLKQFFWLIPLTIFALNGFFALYTGLFALLFYLLPKKNIIFFALLFTFFELLRGKLLTGFPWNYLSYSWGNNLEMMQIVSVIGVEGLLFFTVLYCSMPVLLKKVTLLNSLYCIFGTILMIATFFWGHFRLVNANNEYTEIVVRLVQSGIKSKPLWEEERAKKTVKTNIDLTLSENIDKITHVIWSESSIPFLLGEGSEPFVTQLLQHIPKTLIIGSDRKVGNKVFNSIFVLKGNAIFDYYDKMHLVPFGEFIPFRKLLPFIKMVTGSVDYSSGTEDKLLDYVHPFTPTICYESIFPGDFRLKHSQWIVNITNDSWFGTSTGPYQHFTISRARTIESGLPMARVSSNGISAMIDSYGRIISIIPLDQKGIVDAKLPKKIDETIYIKYYIYIHWFIIITSLLLIFFTLIKLYKCKQIKHS